MEDKMKKKILLITGIIAVSLFGQQNFKVMSYNSLLFPEEYGTERIPYFRTVLQSVNPDILLMQELTNTYGAIDLLNILNENGEIYSRATFVNHGDTSSMLFYKHDFVNLIAQSAVEAWPRNLAEYQVEIYGKPIFLYSCHLKASSTATDQQWRLAAVTNLRNHINQKPHGTEFIIAGDMNYYHSNEPAYQKMIASEENNISRMIDLCSEVGYWSNNQAFSHVHTQSPRFNQFWGGIGGGLDDKFDFILGNYHLNNGSGIEYVENSFLAYGNDGNHFDQSVNYGTNSAVPVSVANALYYASDHLPVIAEFSISNQSISLLYPTGGQTFMQGEEYDITWESENVDEQISIELWNHDNFSQTLATNIANIGTWNWQIPNTIANGQSYLIKIKATSGLPYDISHSPISIGSGMNENSVFISEYVEGSSYNKAIEIFNGTGNSIDLSQYSLKKQTNGAGDFGSEFVFSGVLANQDVIVIAHGSASQAILDIADFISGGVCNFNGNDAIALFQNSEMIDVVGVIDSSADWGKDVTLVRKSFIASPSVIFNLSDWDSYPSNTFEFLGQHVFNPISTEEELLPQPILFMENYPNPFNPTTTIRFSGNLFADKEAVTIEIFNVKGQRIKQFKMKNGKWKMNEVVWDGTDNQQNPVSSGVYFYQIKTDSGVMGTKKMMLMK
jgi:endonuclease/exonuclease/phosphatase family metal-dependent hydrolase